MSAKFVAGDAPNGWNFHKGFKKITEAFSEQKPEWLSWQAPVYL